MWGKGAPIDNQNQNWKMVVIIIMIIILSFAWLNVGPWAPIFSFLFEILPGSECGALGIWIYVSTGKLISCFLAPLMKAEAHTPTKHSGQS